MSTASRLQKREGPTNLLDGWAFSGAGEATGSPIHGSALGDRCVSVSGALDGASITIEGTNDHDEDSGAAVWFTLNDPFGNALTFVNTTGMRQVLETPYRTRAVCSGAGPSTNVKVTLHARRTVR
jgi:hypothetical protein